jgi:hypothetical protein
MGWLEMHLDRWRVPVNVAMYLPLHTMLGRYQVATLTGGVSSSVQLNRVNQFS